MKLKTPRMKPVRVLVLVSALSVAAHAALPEKGRVLFTTLCLDCHNSEKAKGNLDLEKHLAAGVGFAGDATLLEDAIEKVAAGEMPPAKAKRQATDAEAGELVAVMRAELLALQRATQDDPGAIVLSRLTKSQYDYVIRDLTGKRLQPAKYFPDDVVAPSGFNNAGADLTISPAHMDSYLSAARYVLSHALVTPERGIRWFDEPAPIAQKPDELRKALLTEWLNWHVNEESRTLRERYDDEFDMTRSEKNVLRFGDYWEAAWRMKHGRSLAEVAAVADPPLVVPVLRRWTEILNEPKPTPLIGHLTAWWKKLPAPSPETLPAMRKDAEAWSKLLMSLQRPIWNKRWFETRADRVQELSARGPGEVTEVTANTGNTFSRLKQSPNYKQSATYGYLEEARFKLEIDLAKFSQKELVLVVTDAWDGPTGDEVRWHQMKFVFADGHEQDVPELTLQAPATRRLPVPEGAKRFHAMVQLGDRDKTHASAQAIVLDRDPTDAEARLYPLRYVLTWPEGRTRWLTAMGDVMHLFARSTKAAEGRNSRSIYATDFLPQGTMPKLEDTAPEFPDGPYHLDQAELVALASPEARAARDALGRDLVAIAQLPLRSLQAGEKTEADQREGVIPAYWNAAQRATAVEFVAETKVRAADQLTAFLRQAWRREITLDEREHFTGLFAREYANGASYDASMKHALLVALVSPHFLYRNRVMQPAVAATDPSASRPVSPLSPHELASRLSFFLWSSVPDAALLEAAKSGTVDVKTQSARMLKDPRIGALAEEFFGRWLGFHGFNEWSAPDAERFPEFTPTLRQAMHDEARAFFTALLREDRPLTEIVRSRSVFANEELARHYGLVGVTGGELREVDAGPVPRGGLLGLGSILTRTSAPLRTSAVLRGKWIVETLLGRHVPPPPANVPQISSDEKDDRGLSVSQQLARHRSNATCAACHAKLDPPGLAMEHFDPIGRWRQTYRGDVPIVTTTELGGQPLEGLDGLRRYLDAHLDEVARTLCERLVEFGLGRRVEPGDAALRARMFAAMRESSWRVSPAVEQLVTSPQFTHRRAAIFVSHP